MPNPIKFPTILIALILGSCLIICIESCHKTPPPSSIYGTYSGTSTNSGLVHGFSAPDTTIADSFVISAGGSSSSSDTVTVLETHFNVTMQATISSNTDTLYINSQPVTYAGHACIFTGTTGLILSNNLTLSISESSTTNGANLGTLVFEGSD